MPRVGIVGCGLIGRKRAAVLSAGELVACADPAMARAEELARTVRDALAYDDWRGVVERPDIELVMVATPHNALAEITSAALGAGKHVLVEKPAARSAAELAPVIDAQRQRGPMVHVGFNHRFHPAVMQAGRLVNSGALGDLLYIRGRYGHGGRPGYETEWRADPSQSGGGELVDQGIHLIDLARLFLGDFVQVRGATPTYFWRMPVEDNAFMMLTTARDQVAFLHASWTEWKNLFSLEIFGVDGKLEISGLGGSYGTERLTHYRMLPAMGPPETETWEYPGPDTSWGAEYARVVDDIKEGRPGSPGLADAHAALEVVAKIYASSRP